MSPQTIKFVALTGFEFKYTDTHYIFFKKLYFQKEYHALIINRIENGDKVVC